MISAELYEHITITFMQWKLSYDDQYQLSWQQHHYMHWSCEQKHEKFHFSSKLEYFVQLIYGKHSVDDNTRFAVLISFHGTIIMGPRLYNYNGFMIIVQPHCVV